MGQTEKCKHEPTNPHTHVPSDHVSGLDAHVTCMGESHLDHLYFIPTLCLELAECSDSPQKSLHRPWG